MNQDLKRQLVAVLFAAAQPVPARKLAAAVGSDIETVDAALAAAKAELAQVGLAMIKDRSGYLLATASDTAPAITAYLGEEARSDLSKPLLETLAIIAFKQPIAKGEIDEIRGVSSDQALKNLLLRGLIVEDGKSPRPGRPTLYATSTRFLQQFGLTSPDQLPKLEELTHETESISSDIQRT